MAEERHAYIVPGISRDTFVTIANKMTTADASLEYYIHGHKHSMWNEYPCNQDCILIKEGISKNLVEKSLTPEAETVQ